jgi:hypothetical protein
MCILFDRMLLFECVFGYSICLVLCCIVALFSIVLNDFSFATFGLCLVFVYMCLVYR